MANKDIQKEIRSLDDTAQFTLSTRPVSYTHLTLPTIA